MQFMPNTRSQGKSLVIFDLKIKRTFHKANNLSGEVPPGLVENREVTVVEIAHPRVLVLNFARPSLENTSKVIAKPAIIRNFELKEGTMRLILAKTYEEMDAILNLIFVDSQVYVDTSRSWITQKASRVFQVDEMTALRAEVIQIAHAITGQATQMLLRDLIRDSERGLFRDRSVFDKSGPVNIDMILEMYDNFQLSRSDNDQWAINIRGEYVPLQLSAMCAILGVPNHPIEPLKDFTRRLDYKEIRETMCGPDSEAKWTRYDGKYRRHKSMQMRNFYRDARVWLRLLNNWITPLDYYTNVQKERVCIVYFLMKVACYYWVFDDLRDDESVVEQVPKVEFWQHAHHILDDDLMKGDGAEGDEAESQAQGNSEDKKDGFKPDDVSLSQFLRLSHFEEVVCELCMLKICWHD
ncbi:hypothetical protein RND71_021735 [Anisodus tanguticus]|uniref:Uncharacterized protein n=1 Tax=Anisodus tanguticus TaxID=243964 RepID=A0AAE1RX38_9SOLA|nr:hypothetical protein RND71_021735 [Anisodus tanguticus]